MGRHGQNMLFVTRASAGSGGRGSGMGEDGLMYRRVMLKLSGEALMGDQQFGLHLPTVDRLASEIKGMHELGVEVCLVIGGGNIFRGLQAAELGLPRTTADHLGMLATVMNALAMQAALETLGVHTRLLSAIRLDEMCEPYISRRANRHLEKQRVCIFAAGTGNPFYSTDSAAVLRASELNCEVILKGTKVDGVYDKDPKTHADAERFESITYDEVLSWNLRVMDASAIAMARENKIQIIVFSLGEDGNCGRVVRGEGRYTIIRAAENRAARDQEGNGGRHG